VAGHSKWNNIKHKKGKTDAQRAKIFTKVGREMAVAIREGGPDPVSNGKLRDLIAKAKSLNVPNENIERSIKKAGEKDAGSYESITYEGYGPNGVALMVDCLTDNRNRTAGDLRHYFDKFGGNLGQTGSVGFLFHQEGVIVLEAALGEDAAMELCISCGALDFSPEDGYLEFYTKPDELEKARRALEEAGHTPQSAELIWQSATLVNLDEDGKIKMEKLLEMLEDNDDVQEVWHNWGDGG